MAIKNFEELGDVRPVDLIAKMARVTLKDTIRVLIALNVVRHQFELGLEEVIPENYEFDTSWRTPQQHTACEQAYAHVKSVRPAGLRAIRKYARKAEPFNG